MSGPDGQQAAGAGDPPTLGAIPPSFGASSPAPPTAPTAPPAPSPAAPSPAAPPTAAPPTAAPPTAGPFATSATPARRGIGRFSLAVFARPPRRGRLANVLLFGFGPLALAGIIVAAFVLVSPSPGSATSRLGFQAGPAASARPFTASSPAAPTASASSPAAHRKHHVRATPSAAAKVPVISRTVPKAKTTPRPARKTGGGGVVPHNLGLPNFAGYCQHHGQRTAELIATNAYGWRCTLNSSRPLLVTNVCAWTYHLSVSQVIDMSANYYDPNAWQCWRINRDLGVLNFATYCTAAGLGTSQLVAQDAYGWYCTAPSAPVNTTAACDTVYHVSDAVSRFAVFVDPYSWQCWN